MGLLKAGDHVVCSQSVFGSTIMLFGREFAKFGVETSVRLADRRRRSGGVRSSRTRGCCSPNRPPTR